MLLRRATAAAAGCGAVKRVCQLHGGYRSPALGVNHPRGQQHVPSRPFVCPTGISTTFRQYSTRLVVACAADQSTIELEVKVEGMKCGGCSSRVEAALKAMDHVKGVQVDLESKLATVEVEAPNMIDAMNMLPNFVKTIKELGFEAEPHIEYQL